MRTRPDFPFGKNDEIVIDITDLGSSGEGIGKIAVGEDADKAPSGGFAFFIKDALPGDRIRAKITKLARGYGFARLMEVIKPSPQRVEPRCPLARRCGGCQIQEMEYQSQLAYKTGKVREDLIRLGGLDPALVDSFLHPAVGMEEPFRYRNKEQVPVGKDREGRVVTGFYAGRTHSIIPMEDCLLGRQENAGIIRAVKAWMEENRVSPYEEGSGRGLIRHILIRNGIYSGQVMVCLVANADKLPAEKALARSLMQEPGVCSVVLNTNREKTNVILGKKNRTLAGKDAIEDRLYIQETRYEGAGSPVFHPTKDYVRFGISPLSFYQVNPRQTEKLYSLVLHFAGLTGKEVIWDLYCGVGTISLFLARYAGRVYGVEIVPEAIRDARDNAERNHITNAEFFVGKAEEVLPAYVRDQEKKGGIGRVDLITVDPPRKGCDRVCLDTILEIGPDKVIYVSCDPATLARDLKILTEGGYEIRAVQPVDQFAQTVHIETIVLLQKLNS